MEELKKYIDTLPYKTVSFVFECLILLVAVALVLYIVLKKFQSKKLLLAFASVVILYAISLVMGLKVGLVATTFICVIVVLYGFSFYGPGGAQRNVPKNPGKQNKQFITTEEIKKELIDTIIKTVEHLSNRKVGAIMTIEKEHNLNSLIEGAVKLDAAVTFELLETIFHPNTRLHDGAVIIRGDRIVCASAFFQPSQKKDIPQHYGSRHRAAIGISEQSDSFTIVVSEETGHIATTIGGTITGNVALENLRNSLNQQLIVR